MARVETFEFAGVIHVQFTCPGCKLLHSLPVRIDGGERPSWEWNGSLDRPTFTPSILSRSGHYARHHEGGECWCNYKERTGEETDFKCGICHSFVTDGKIQFLSDCTHELARQTVELPELEEGT